jgi:hypothetical protein
MEIIMSTGILSVQYMMLFTPVTTSLRFLMLVRGFPRRSPTHLPELEDDEITLRITPITTTIPGTRSR